MQTVCQAAKIYGFGDGSASAHEEYTETVESVEPTANSTLRGWKARAFTCRESRPPS